MSAFYTETIIMTSELVSDMNLNSDALSYKVLFTRLQKNITKLC